MNTIYGDAIARAPLTAITYARDRTPAGSTLRKSFDDVMRVVSVQLIAGVVPEGMTAQFATKRGVDLLKLLNSWKNAK